MDSCKVPGYADRVCPGGMVRVGLVAGDIGGDGAVAPVHRVCSGGAPHWDGYRLAGGARPPGGDKCQGGRRSVGSGGGIGDGQGQRVRGGIGAVADRQGEGYGGVGGDLRGDKGGGRDVALAKAISRLESCDHR